MTDLAVAWNTLARARDARDEARKALREALFDLHRLNAGIELAQRGSVRDTPTRDHLAGLLEERTATEATVRTRTEALAESRARVQRDFVQLLESSPPQRLIGGLDDATPILMMPLRIETRFGVHDSHPVLRIRMFLDDIGIAQHEKQLTQREADDGRAYWKERIRANAEPDARKKKTIVTGAWTVLASRHSAYRASWIARATQPTNWSDALGDPALALYPPIDVKPLSWSEAPRSFVMPDRFVVRLYAGGASREVTGALIPDDLPLGPDPLQAEGVFTRDEGTGKLLLDPALRWLVDFEEAVKVGMALRIPLVLPKEANGFSRILVLGMRLASSPAEGAASVERTFEAHRYSRGMSIVPQGTPTNNTDDARSGLPTPSDSIEETLSLERDPTALEAHTDHYKKSDGQRLAEAIGISLETVRSLPSAARLDVAEALAMNRALWSGTLGAFAHDMLSPLFSNATIEKVQRFFGAYVSGRGLLPAVRVGSQPYGVLATSALSLWNWTEDEVGDEATFWNGVLVRLQILRNAWNALVPHAAFVGDAGDPFETLLKVVGLQASSVEYYSRKAISNDYLANYARFRGTPQAYATELWEQMRSAAAPNLSAIGLDPAVAFPLRSLIFWREHDLLNGPLIDDDPRVPFSETRGIRPFDGSRNYIDWFRTATSQEIRQGLFKDANGSAIAAPATLLYRLLRASFLSELGRSGRKLVKDLAPGIFAELEPEPFIANVGSTKTFSTDDVLNIDAAKVGASRARVSLADHLIGGARATPGANPPPEVAGLADLNTALGLLAPLPTARLERLLAEHIDLCSYRLDAWIQGLFARRLWHLRERAAPGSESSHLHVGCYGWVEYVTPATGARRAVSADTLPTALRAEATGAIFEDSANGGFVHAPSLTHAVTAAVLRNAYLSHAEPARAEMMAVNLSSARVRKAMSYIEGLRNGQELSALLGYQLERGLHENHPGVELDQYIYVLRDRFPLTSNKLTEVPAGTASEAMEARNVINGYDLLEHLRGRTYPYAIAGLPDDAASSTAAAKAQAAAIRAEFDALADAMDSIADLMLAESVHQVVQGNYDRAKGVLQSITEGTSPPEPQVIETPRSGRGLMFRMALPLDPTAIAGWRTPLSPRAAANSAVNHWLTTVLPAPETIQWKVTEGTIAPAFVTLASLALEPLDCVLMAGDHLGDFSSELERFLVHDYRVTHAVPDLLKTVIRASSTTPIPVEPVLLIDPHAAAPGKIALASLMPLLKALSRIVSKSRPLHARDFELASEAQEIEPGNPKGFDDGVLPLKDLTDLKTRLESGYTGLVSARTSLANFVTQTIDPLYAAFEADPQHAIAPQWSIALSTLRSRMVAVCRFGVAEALPTAGLDVTSSTIDAAVAQARAVLDVAARRLAAARAALDTEFTDPLPTEPGEAARVRAYRTETLLERYTEAGRQIFGGSFIALPLFRLHAEARPELAAAIASPVEANPLVLEEWMQSLVRVRNAVQAQSTVLTYQDWIGSAPSPLRALQLPARAGDPWIGSAFGEGLPAGEFVSLILTTPMPPIDKELCGLLLDQWTEVVPAHKETTGIAFHFNRPNATAPQALLLAIAPRRTGGWQWNDLTTVIEETFERARMRAVEPDAIAQSAYFQALPTILSEFSAGGFRSTVFAQKAEYVAAPPA